MVRVKKREGDAPKVPGRVHLIQHRVFTVHRRARVEVLERRLVRADEHEVRREHDHREHRE